MLGTSYQEVTSAIGSGSYLIRSMRHRGLQTWENPLNHENVDFGEISGLLGCFGRVDNSSIQAAMLATLSKVEFPYTKKVSQCLFNNS